MPDSFVAIDTTSYSPYYRDLVAKGIPNKYAITYVDEHRKELKKNYTSEKKFIEEFAVSDKMLSDFVALGEQDGVTFSETGFEKSKNLMATVVKGLIARDIFNNGSYYHVVNSLNPIYREALEIISTPQTYRNLLHEQQNQ